MGLQGETVNKEESALTYAEAYRKLTRISYHCRYDEEGGINMPAVVIIDKCQRIVRLTAELAGENVDADVEETKS